MPEQQEEEKEVRVTQGEGRRCVLETGESDGACVDRDLVLALWVTGKPEWHRAHPELRRGLLEQLRRWLARLYLHPACPLRAANSNDHPGVEFQSEPRFFG